MYGDGYGIGYGGNPPLVFDIAASVIDGSVNVNTTPLIVHVTESAPSVAGSAKVDTTPLVVNVREGNPSVTTKVPSLIFDIAASVSDLAECDSLFFGMGL